MVGNIAVPICRLCIRPRRTANHTGSFDMQMSVILSYRWRQSADAISLRLANT